LIYTVRLFAPMVESSARVQRWLDHAQAVQHAIEANAWDGQWYRRASFDDGTWLGSKDSDECQIDSIAQSWAVLSGAAQPERAIQAMNSVEQHLIQSEQQLALLFTPPFDKTKHDPGYIKGYPPGLRENGGQYTHAAMWTLLALTKLGKAQKAHDLFAMLNPINHASTTEQAQRYKVEPYVMAADVYSVEPHAGHGGWTWYTGAAGWMYRAGVEGILGLQREGDHLRIQPCIPASWPGFEVSINIANTQYQIVIEQLSVGTQGSNSAGVVLDGIEIPQISEPLSVPLDGKSHHLHIAILAANEEPV